MARQRENRSPRVTLVGPVNAGKSTLFRALTGVDPGHVSPLEGEFDASSSVKSASGLTVVDYPGFLDVNGDNRGYYLGVDCVVVMVAEKFDLAVLREVRRLAILGRHLIYVRNKIDLLHPAKRDSVLGKIRRELRRHELKDIPVVGTCAGPAEGESARESTALGVVSLKRLLTRKLRAAGWEVKAPWRPPWG